MSPLRAFCAVLASLSLTAAQPYNGIETTTFSLNPIVSRTGQEPKSCTTRQGIPGLCVHESYCNDDHVIEVGGIIDDSELRASDKCVKETEWCCSEKNVTKVANARPGDGRYNIKSCTTARNVAGLCVDESVCNSKGTIERGGNIDDSSLRISECSAKQVCCAESETNTLGNRDGDTKCAVTKRTDCPWCVNLYRDGKDRRKLPSGLFCMGTLISSRVVLTTGTCKLQADGHAVWARVPASADPNANYAIKFWQINPDYNSGTRLNDLSLYLLDKNVEWGSREEYGACIGIRKSPQGDCFLPGIDEDEKFDPIPAFVTTGSCIKGRGASEDAACGQILGETCPTILPGTPVMCHEQDGPFTVLAQAKSSCMEMEGAPKILLGNFNLAAKWLQAQLQTLGLTENEYT